MSEFYGQDNFSTEQSEYNMMVFVFQMLMQKIQTMTLVKVISCSNDGGLSPVGTVTVQPLVNLMSGNRQAIEHQNIFNVPYLRIQGGANAIIIDPEPGDIGACGFCSRDISAVKQAKGPANPGSFRMFDWADGLYFGGFLNGSPTQYFQFNSSGIKVVSPTKITLQAPEIDLIATSKINGTAPNVEFDASTEFKVDSPQSEFTGTIHTPQTITGDTDVVGNGTSLHTHEHSGVTPGGGTSGPPV